MLEYLRIRNLALIQDMELELAPGLNVLTGESGAGKSFILRALDFLLGEKLTRDMIRPGQDKALVEALFVLTDGECVIRREISAETGRSRLFINDGLSAQERVRELAPTLLVHTSQHAQQRLLRPAFHARVLDGFLPNPALLEERDRALDALREVQQKMHSIRERCKELEARRELLEYQGREIDKVAPGVGEEDELLARKEGVRKNAQARANLQQAWSVLNDQESGLLQRFMELQRLLGPLQEFDEEFGVWSASLEDMRATLQDLGTVLRKRGPGEDPGEDLERIEARLWELSQLRRKLNRGLAEIIHLKEEIEENLSFLDIANLDLQRLGKEEDELKSRLAATMAALNRARRESARQVQEDLERELHGLGFSPHVSVQFEFTPAEISPGITEDRPRMLWVPNPGQPPQPLDQIASGGELSRFLLALVGLQSKDELPTLLFDEVDAGIGGLTLNTVGERIRLLSERQQVILITHWPQLARHGRAHFQVVKEVREEETFTLCRRLCEEEVIQELARMAGGGEQGLEMAKRMKMGNSKLEIRNSKSEIRNPKLEIRNEETKK